MRLKDIFLRIWNDKVWSKVIAGVIFAVLGTSPSIIRGCWHNDTTQRPVTKQKQFALELIQYKQPVPRRDGNDVLIPLVVMKSIPYFNESKTIYCATYSNNWLNIPNSDKMYDVIKISIMNREGNEWRAVGLAGTRFHPVQLKDTILKDKYNPKNLYHARFKKLEAVYGDSWERFSGEFLDYNSPGPCLLVR